MNLSDVTDFEDLDGGLMFYALLGCLAALVIGAGWWALGHQAANPHHAGKGKAAAGAALLGALLAGAGPILVDFFTTVGSRIISYNVDRADGHLVHAQLTLVVQTYCSCAWQAAEVGVPIQVRYEVINTGRRPVAAVRLRGNAGAVRCPHERLTAGATLVCAAGHAITAADLAGGQYTATGTVTGAAEDGTALATSADAQAIRLRTK